MSSPSRAAASANPGTPSPASRTHFFELRIRERREEATDACSFLLEPPAQQSAEFSFRPGQHLVVRATLDGTEQRRTYSLCGAAGELRVLVKRVAGGLFSNHALDHWQPGGTLEALRPQGQFCLRADPASARRYLAVAAGSGITPVIAILEDLLAQEPKAEATLLYANKTSASIIFRDRLADLKDMHLDRFTLHHVLSRERTEQELLHGRIDEAKLEQFARHLIALADFDHVLLCGPTGMMAAVRAVLARRRHPASRIHSELFTTGRQPGAEDASEMEAPAGAVHCAAAVVLDGIRHEIDIAANQTVLEAAAQAGLELPFSCRNGVCATCRAQLREGEVTMRARHALDDEEIERGFVLTCQSVPTSAALTVDFDRS